MKQIPGYELSNELVSQLIMAIYGLKQAGRQWNVECDRHMTSFGYTRLLTDTSVYIC